jgi:predicted acylesterase/phospholipase RssA
MVQNSKEKGFRAFGLLTLVSLCMGSGCATLPRTAVPVDNIYDVTVPNMPDIRAWGGEFSPAFQRDFIESTRQEVVASLYEHGSPRNYAALAVSGGGADGAFGAGFLNGWSASGTRPDFKMVTGISTGGLIAPFAFLGADYDAKLKKVFTTISTENIIKMNSIFSILFRSEAFAGSKPLQDLIAGTIDEEMLKAIAERYEQGYRLFIGTTNMDAQRLVVWNMGKIATYGTPQALDLFHKIMVASASIPVALPPVMIEVEMNGHRYDEMHTDGGTFAQVFFHTGIVDLGAAAESAGIDKLLTSDLYVIRNGYLDPETRQIDRKLSDISGRALSTMIKTAAKNDLYRIYTFTLRDDIRFHYVDIPAEHFSESDELFDLAEMNRLYDVGYELGISKDNWQDQPPGFEELEKQL